ncbi:SulP family inorganic anion transporter [Putridiphycobacter roseus]|uniref:SulP family inorganic anion transporter n=1 Tax=Putridiphycobacter roseus TaxID=2219161 RepID=A0A2W1MXI3_9FLAO|nr:SulP family inorganic anion transporter [Putridiphycobacter roseus]PZE16084.1 SulP family inorganic anion transporter [Putridiphycobacter roseus]
MNTIEKPKMGLQGLKAHFLTDLTSGFLVFLLALPLSLGIAKASGFPAAMGVLTAIIGGLFTVFFKVSELSIKGPAAGLITISAAAVLEFGGGTHGWQIVCALIVVMAFLQIIMGLLKLGSLSDFFPHSAVHGMLAAIGIIIIAKQIPVLLGDDPTLYKGEGPIALLLDIPKFVLHSHWHIAVIGVVGLIIMFVMPRFKVKFINKIPAPMLVLLVAVPLTIIWHFKQTEPEYSLVAIGDFWGSLAINADFSEIATFAFWKYVIMFLFVSTLESLLTVKAIDSLDPYKRQSNYNGDLIGQGAGNVISGLFGGLPMISEVVRSSANIGFGAKTKWSNFFQGVFLLLAMIFIIPLIELIPNAALAAMLIYAGYRLAAPREFIHTYKVGKEQLVIFLITVIVTLAEDLLLGILAGILVKFIFHLANGVSFSNLFSARGEIIDVDGTSTLVVEDAAVFSNLISFKKKLSTIPDQNNVVIDFEKSKLVDHSFMSFIHNYQNEKREMGITCEIIGLENHKPFSSHPLATHKLNK